MPITRVSLLLLLYVFTFTSDEKPSVQTGLPFAQIQQLSGTGRWGGWRQSAPKFLPFGLGTVNLGFDFMEVAFPLLPTISLDFLNSLFSGGMCILKITVLEVPGIFRMTPATWTDI